MNAQGLQQRENIASILEELVHGFVSDDSEEHLRLKIERKIREERER